MREIDQRVSDALKAERAARDNDASVSYETRRNVMARMKRNDRITFSAAGVVVVAASAALFFVLSGKATLGQEPSPAPIAPAATASETPEGTVSPTGGEDPTKKTALVDAAVWPETTRELAARACEKAPAWRADRQATVDRFAFEFLRLGRVGEERALIRRIEGDNFYAVSGSLEGPLTQVQVGQFGAAGCWSVTAASAPEVVDLLSYEFRDGRFEVVFDNYLSAIDLSVTWGGSNAVADTENADRIAIDLGPPDPDEPGSWIAVLKDADREILGVWAGTFPAGDSSAG